MDELIEAKHITFCKHVKHFVIDIDGIRFNNWYIDTHGLNHADLLPLILKINKILEPNQQQIEIHIRNLHILFNGNTITCCCHKRNDLLKGVRKIVMSDDMQLAFTNFRNDICKRLYKSRIWFPYCKKWFLCYSSFKKQLFNTISENPNATALAIFEKL